MFLHTTHVECVSKLFKNEAGPKKGYPASFQFCPEIGIGNNSVEKNIYQTNKKFINRVSVEL